MLDISNFRQGYVYPPGETISDVLADKSMSISDFASMLGNSLAFVQSLISGQERITEPLAHKLSNILGSTSSFWLKRERRYVEFLELLNAPISDIDKEWLSEMPVSSMQGFGWIPKSRSAAQNLISCLNFFGVPNAISWREQYKSAPELARFRTSQSFNPQLGAVAAWIKHCEMEADFIDCAAWDRDGFIASLPELKALTLESDPNIFIPEIQRICSRNGVAVVIARTPSGCQASGATKFVSDEKALLMLSFRYLSDDHFWFTFFHEAGHLILHGKKALFIEVGDACDDDQEREANRFSQELLIPTERLCELPRIKDNIRLILKFARNIGVSPGIVVGQLQHQGLLKPYHMNKLKVRYSWADDRSPSEV